jgi:hypothetical protein
MTTDTFTPLRHAAPADIRPAEPTREEPLTRAAVGSRETIPHRRGRGAWRLVTSLISSDDRQLVSDRLLLLGPSGGPLWASRVL